LTLTAGENSFVLKIYCIYFRIELALEMKKELIRAFKKAKNDLDELNRNLRVTKDSINVLQKEFNLSGLKNK
jgi:hypothetical protein